MSKGQTFWIWVIAISAPFPLLAQPPQSTAKLQRGLVEVPFVGCEYYGNGGHEPAPRGAPKRLRISPAAARALAYYRSALGPGILAPRGWHCLGRGGSAASNLYVSSKPIGLQEVQHDGWRLTGPAVQATLMAGGTSGRFEVAAIVKRLFPAFRWFSDEVEKEQRNLRGEAPFEPFPEGPYPQDTLVYRSDHVVEFSTPEHAEGLGNLSRLAKQGGPIEGAVGVIPNKSTDAWRLAVHLPKPISHLRRTIIDFAVADVGRWPDF